jgi:hypothetical protein
MQQKRMARWAATGFGLTFGLVACGGATPEAPDTPATQGAATAPGSSPLPDAQATPGQASAPAADPDIGPLNVAVVTIGDDRYEFSDVQCSIFAPRYIQAGNFGGDPEVSIVLPPEGWESDDRFDPPSVRVTIGDDVGGQQWVAGDDGSVAITPIPEGSSRIDSYAVPDGRPVKATGTATFIDLVAHNNGQPAPPVSGSFEVSCP